MLIWPASRKRRPRCRMCAISRILHDLGVRRGLIRIGEDVVNNAYEAPHDKPPQAQIEEAEKALYRLADTARYGEGPIDFVESLRRAVASAEAAQAFHEIDR